MESLSVDISIFQDSYTATGSHTWMRTSAFRALRAKFKDVSDTFKEKRQKKTPDEVEADRRAAWHGVIDQFIDIEIPDKLEMFNMQWGVPNPLAVKKLDVFSG
jgi:hypothetical protein